MDYYWNSIDLTELTLNPFNGIGNFSVSFTKLRELKKKNQQSWMEYAKDQEKVLQNLIIYWV